MTSHPNLVLLLLIYKLDARTLSFYLLSETTNSDCCTVNVGFSEAHSSTNFSLLLLLCFVTLEEKASERASTPVHSDFTVHSALWLFFRREGGNVGRDDVVLRSAAGHPLRNNCPALLLNLDANVDKSGLRKESLVFLLPGSPRDSAR